MSWMQHLAEVYDNNIDMVGVFETRNNKEFTLVPVAHITQNAQLEVILNRDGTFHRASVRSEEHTSELQSRFDLVCRLLLEKKKNISQYRLTSVRLYLINVRL